MAALLDGFRTARWRSSAPGAAPTVHSAPWRRTAPLHRDASARPRRTRRSNRSGWSPRPRGASRADVHGGHAGAEQRALLGAAAPCAWPSTWATCRAPRRTSSTPGERGRGDGAVHRARACHLRRGDDQRALTPPVALSGRERRPCSRGHPPRRSEHGVRPRRPDHLSHRLRGDRCNSARPRRTTDEDQGGRREDAAALDAKRAQIEAIASSLGERYSVRLAMPDADADHLRWFDRRRAPHQPARPVFAITPDDARGGGRSGHSARARGPRIVWSHQPTALLQAGAQAMREVWVQRLSLNGAGMPWSPLSLRYARWKHRRGLDPRTGVARGNMLACGARRSRRRLRTT